MKLSIPINEKTEKDIIKIIKDRREVGWSIVLTIKTLIREWRVMKDQIQAMEDDTAGSDR